MCLLHAGFLTSLLSDSTQITQLSTSYNSAFELAQRVGLNLQALGQALEDSGVSELNTQLRAQAELTQKQLKLPSGSSAVVSNGRVVIVDSPELGISEEFTAEDFGLLVSLSVQMCIAFDADCCYCCSSTYDTLNLPDCLDVSCAQKACDFFEI